MGAGGGHPEASEVQISPISHDAAQTVSRHAIATRAKPTRDRHAGHRGRFTLPMHPTYAAVHGGAIGGGRHTRAPLVRGCNGRPAACGRPQLALVDTRLGRRGGGCAPFCRL